ncbi:hypothetical protein SAMN05216574_11215 [Blastococcus tunisiensis]|uniref:Helix-turn-helix domain-containing protein n=2 Tax=Blastococcus tunisiensis TaxID=1798228 RepID=A0A1I2I1T5_9ACTN|nr:hypothetical protein SAMN05216574_11215 [Blastococcus sp. DSM 46838]
MSDQPSADGLEEQTEPEPPAAAAQRGAILRAWRVYRGLGLDAVARHAKMSDAALSEWERGELNARRRRVFEPLEKVTRIDARLQADGALVDLWQAVGSSDALPPRSDWMHNYRIGGKPGWLWIRSAWDCTVDLAWGPLRGRTAVSAGSGGVLIQLPITLDNPPLRASTTSPAWADFGAGIVPAEVSSRLGIVRVMAQDLHEPNQEARRRLPVPGGLFRDPLGEVRSWARDLGVRWELIRPHIGVVLATDNPEHALDSADVSVHGSSGEVRFDREGRLISQLTMRPEQLRALRMARGYSHDRAAQRVSEMDDGLPTLSRAALERVERLGALPRAENWLPRLDMAYRADGRVGIERTFDSIGAELRSRRRGTRWVTAMTFPDYWVGPIWLQARSPGGRSDVGSIRLVWGPWRRRQRVGSGQVVTMRKARPGADPLFVDLPAGWRFAAGTGAVGTGMDINDDWQPRSALAGLALLLEALATIRAWRRIAQSLSASRSGDAEVRQPGSSGESGEGS